MSATDWPVREREGKMVRHCRADALKPGDLVQHYSTWEQTWGDPMLREVVENGYVPADAQHRRLITWRDPRCPSEGTYQTRARPDEGMDVVVSAAAEVCPPLDVLDVLAHVVAERDEAIAERDAARAALDAGSPVVSGGAARPGGEGDSSHYAGPCPTYREALQTIAGPSDAGPFIHVYREAGGGYEGLQAIARAALTEGQET